MARNGIDGEFAMDANVSAELSCGIVTTIEYPHRCIFVTAVRDCQSRLSIINYMSLFFCSFNPQNVFMSVIYVLCFLVLCFILFLLVTYIVDIALLPAIKVICSVCRFNEHLAGSTLLAAATCAPSFLSTLGSAIRQEDQHDFFSNLYASLLFTIIFVGGLIITLTPFIMHPTNAIRDAGFVLLAILYVDYTVRTHNCMSVGECLVILAIYAGYLTVVVIDEILISRTLKQMGAMEEQWGKRKSVFQKRLLSSVRDDATFVLKRRSLNYLLSKSAVKRNRFNRKNPNAGMNDGLFWQFITSVNPIRMSTFNAASKFKKALLLLKSPLKAIIILMLPVVDYEKPGHGWSKLLNCLQIVLIPLLIVYNIWGTEKVLDFPIIYIPLICTVPISLFVFGFTRTDIPPPGHIFFAFLSGAGSIMGLYICSSEIMEMFRVIGIVLHCSADFLSCTLICWGMSFNDLVGNVAYALGGYQRMGYAACFGSAIFTSTLVVGCNFLIKALSAKTDCYVVLRSPIDENGICFLLLGLLFTIIHILLLNCRARRSVGIFSIGLYLFFLFFTILSEVSVLHSYSNDLLTFTLL